MSGLDVSRVALGSVAQQLKRRSKEDSSLPVYAVTKHRGFVPSLEYFKKQVFSRDTNGYNEVLPGEIAYATIHLDEGSIGVSPVHCLISPMYTSFAVDPETVLPAYLVRFLKSPETLAKYEVLGRGSVHRRRAISFSSLSALSIPVPPLAEQKRIVAILDAADALRAKRRESLGHLDKLLQSIFLEMFGDPVTNPRGWITDSLEAVTRKITDGTHKTPAYTDSGVAFLSAKDLKDGEIRWNTGKFISHEEHAHLFRRCNPERGDLLLAKSGSLGSVAVIDRDLEFSLFESLCLIKHDPKKLDASFLACMIRSPAMQTRLLEKNKGIAIKHLHLIDVRALEILLPPLPLQQSFATVVESITQQKNYQRAHLGELNLLFASLQSRAFRGDV